MIRHRCALLCLVVLAPALAQDAQPDPRAAKLARFLEASGRKELAKTLLEQVLTKAAPPQKVVDATWRLADQEFFSSRLSALYADLDDATLDAAIAFYETPAGKKLAQVQATHDAEFQTLTRDWLTQLDRKIKGRYGVSLLQGKKAPKAKPNYPPADRDAAIGALKTLNTAQALFREGDKDQNQEFDYANSLKLLGDVGLIDSELASGKKAGYRFEICTGSEAPEFLWMAIASPIDPNSNAPYLVVNQSAVIYTSPKPLKLDRKNCKIPQEESTPLQHRR